jgi:hypothetical protein
MRKQDKLNIDYFWSRSLEKEMPAREPAMMGDIGDRQAIPAKLAPLTVNSGRLGRFTARIAIFSVCSLLLAAVMLAAPATSSAVVAVGISVAFAPPALPVYVQPVCPGPRYIWIPGYWAWEVVIGYYWVPGTWVLAPFPGALWTPGYWGWSDGVYVWYGGYWGPVVGFYGGINYGFGYFGFGFDGGYWSGGTFYYNRAVTNINITNITTVYNTPVSVAAAATRVSFNGGPCGTTVRPTARQLDAARQKRSGPTTLQSQHERAARSDPKLRAVVNHGRPAIAATTKPGVLTGPGVIRASRAGAPYKAPPSSLKVAPGARARTQQPAGTKGRPSVTAPERAAPRARTLRPVAPGNQPARREYRPSKPRTTSPEERTRVTPRRVPEERTRVAPRTVPDGGRPGVAPRTAPRRPETPRESPKDNTKREEGGPH